MHLFYYVLIHKTSSPHHNESALTSELIYFLQKLLNIIFYLFNLSGICALALFTKKGIAYIYIY